MKKFMRVILLEDIKNLGHKDEIKEVSAGYARNFLLPKKLVVLADPSHLATLEARKKKEELEREKEWQRLEELASKLRNLELTIAVEANETGTLFGSIGPFEIIEELEKQGFELSKEQIDLKEPIKEIGSYSVKIKWTSEMEATILVNVIAVNTT